MGESSNYIRNVNRHYNRDFTPGLLVSCPVQNSEHHPFFMVISPGNRDPMRPQSRVRKYDIASNKLSASPRPLVVPLGVPLLVVLDLVHRPHGAFHVLHPLEALVEREIVANCVLKVKNSDDFKCISRVSEVQVPGTRKTFFIVAKVR